MVGEGSENMTKETEPFSADTNKQQIVHSLDLQRKQVTNFQQSYQQAAPLQNNGSSIYSIQQAANSSL